MTDLQNHNITVYWLNVKIKSIFSDKDQGHLEKAKKKKKGRKEESASEGTIMALNSGTGTG